MVEVLIAINDEAQAPPMNQMPFYAIKASQKACSQFVICPCCVHLKPALFACSSAINLIAMIYCKVASLIVKKK